MGITPKQTSNLLQLIRMGLPIRSLLYRRAEQPFAIGVSLSSLTCGAAQSRRFSGRRPYCTVLRGQPGEEDGVVCPQCSATKGGLYGSHWSLFSYTYSTAIELLTLRPGSGKACRQGAGDRLWPRRTELRPPCGIPCRGRLLRAAIYPPGRSHACRKVRLA